MLYGSVSGGALQIGDRVIVASSMAGTKTGTLRYLGPADFAKGEWAGIELDAPLGENFFCILLTMVTAIESLIWRCSLSSVHRTVVWR
jgi:hypothetical protein